MHIYFVHMYDHAHVHSHRGTVLHRNIHAQEHSCFFDLFRILLADKRISLLCQQISASGRARLENQRSSVQRTKTKNLLISEQQIEKKNWRCPALLCWKVMDMREGGLAFLSRSHVVWSPPGPPTAGTRSDCCSCATAQPMLIGITGQSDRTIIRLLHSKISERLDLSKVVLGPVYCKKLKGTLT